jgi:hypothetical protein
MPQTNRAGEEVCRLTETAGTDNNGKASGEHERGWTGNHSVFGGYHNGGMTRMQSDHGFSSMGAGRIFGGGGMRSGGGMHGGGGRR